MKQYIFITLCYLFLISCETDTLNNTQQYKGDIYITLINIHNIYGIPEAKIKEFKERINRPNQNEYSESEIKLNKYYKILIKHDLFNKPSFKIKINNEIVNVYTEEDEYSKLKSVLSNFDKYEEKITVKFDGNKVSDGVIDSEGVFNQKIYYASKIISVTKKLGRTEWHK